MTRDSFSHGTHHSFFFVMALELRSQIGIFRVPQKRGWFAASKC